MTDLGGQTSTVVYEVVSLDTTAPTTALAAVLTMVSDGEAVVGDSYFLTVSAVDDKSEVASVTVDTTSEALIEVASVEEILQQTYSLTETSSSTTTHALLRLTDSATYSVGDNAISVTIKDTAGNTATATTSLAVVSKRTNRNFLLFPGTNYVGLALIPDDGDSTTSDDASIARLLTQDITSAVSDAMQADPAYSGGVTLSDIITTASAFSNAGNFLMYNPGPAADTLTDLSPFQGMIIKVAETKTHSVATSTSYDIFGTASVSGFTAAQPVPIKVNIAGVFFDPDSTPPTKTLRVGYNLVAPHILTDTLFDSVFRGALIPNELAVSAIAFERSLTPTSSASAIGVEIFEGFTANSLGDELKPEFAYWTFIVQDSATNPTTPTITP